MTVNRTVRVESNSVIAPGKAEYEDLISDFLERFNVKGVDIAYSAVRYYEPDEENPDGYTQLIANYYVYPEDESGS